MSSSGESDLSAVFSQGQLVGPNGRRYAVCSCNVAADPDNSEKWYQEWLVLRRKHLADGIPPPPTIPARCNERSLVTWRLHIFESAENAKSAVALGIVIHIQSVTRF